ncbi:hypothetical protein J1792_33260 [Streptomyces triculaminicus]|uniref:Uncharacterized protein n=1 Tax=Streptomyces triculaminicus TaxID=2816232 RepID=A0A939FVC8_9ACTN|nr:hypothetical protein [Streptomyces triculaminicus]MBO0657408.1 hypothetical protein [Streptomyces triculaminicus]
MTPDWVTAFADTPRKRFLPSVMWPYDQASEEHVTVDRSADFESWNRYACSDMAIITQWDDGASTRARAQRLTVGDYDTYVTADAKEGAQKSHTALPHDEVFGTTLWDANQFALGLCVPAVIHTKGLVENGARPVWLLSLNDRSWACVLFRDNGARFTVYQYGHRRLWDEIEAAHTWWTEQGRPGFGNFGLTIDKAGQHVWLDAEDNVVSSRPLIAAHD